MFVVVMSVYFVVVCIVVVIVVCCVGMEVCVGCMVRLWNCGL